MPAGHTSKDAASMARRADLNQWAKLGATARLKEILEELASIYRVFPELRGRRNLKPASWGGRRKRARFSAEGKNAISEGLRKVLGPAEKRRQPRLLLGSRANRLIHFGAVTCSGYSWPTLPRRSARPRCRPRCNTRAERFRVHDHQGGRRSGRMVHPGR